MSSTPTAIELDLRENLMTITWSDGVTCLYDGGYLRFVCPCADCRGHAPGQVPPPEWERCKDVRLGGAEQVGAYAIRLGLSDGHATGIYSFDHLRAHCPGDKEGLDERGRPLA